MEVLLVSPVRPINIVIAKMVPYLLLSCINLASILLLARFALGVPMSGNMTAMVGVSLLYLVLALAFGLLISTVTDRQSTAIIISGMLLLLPIIMLSGMAFPVENMPDILRAVSCAVPTRWYIAAMRKLMIEGLPFAAVLKEAAILAAAEPLGGFGWVKPGMTVAVKTNLISRMPPESAAITHPECLAALTRILVRLGARVVVGDSSGGPFTAAWIHAVYAGTGMEAVRKSGGELNEDFESVEARFPEGKTVKSFPYTAWLKKADAIIDFAKLKTHGMANMTCAVKNFFGSIPGTRKPEQHYLHQSVEEFCSMLCDLALYNAPRLTLVDAVDCMEGNGPSHGTPRHMGAILAADTPFNADLVCAHLIGLDTADAPTVAESSSATSWSTCLWT